MNTPLPFRKTTRTQRLLQGSLFAIASLCISAGASTLTHADSSTHIGQVKGQTVDAIEGVDHTVYFYAGPPDERTALQQLDDLHVAVAPEDRIEAFPDPALGLGSALTVTRATLITVVDANQRSDYRTWVSTVADLLDEQEISIGKDDSIDKDEKETIEDKMTITITRVEVTEVDEKESIAFSKVSVDDSTMEKGESKLLQAGKNGVRTKTFRVRRENGKEVERKLINTEITTEPVTEKTAKGTKVVVFGSGEATWYKRPGHTAGAASNTLPFGTKVHVVNLTNSKSVDVTINDRGIQGSAIIDLNKEAFEKIAPLGAGRISVRMEKYYGN